jgi:hypothetical protein
MPAIISPPSDEALDDGPEYFGMKVTFLILYGINVSL